MSAITTIALLPLLLIVLGTTLELGALRVVAARIHSAADLAVLVAVNDQNDAELARSGHLEPATDAADVARAILAANLEPIADVLAAQPAAVASAATVSVQTSPPTVRLSLTVPVRTPLFGVLFFHPVTSVTVKANGGAR